MSKFDRYVVSQLMVLFGFFSLVLVAIYWVNSTVQIFDRLIADGQSAGKVLAFTALSLPFVIALVIPMSAFAATAYVTNRLNTESELVVVQATGFSPFRLARPFLAFGILVALMAAVLMNLLVPLAARIAAQQQEALARNVTAQFLSPGEFLHPVQGVTFYIGALTTEGALRSVFLNDARSDNFHVSYMAREAYLLAQEDGPRLVMVDGIAQSLARDGMRLAVTRFDDFTYNIARLIEGSRPPRVVPRQLWTGELLRADPARVEALGSSAASFRWEAHNRITQPLLSIVAVMIGFATLLIGAYSRFGIWRQILAAIVLIVVVKMVDNTLAATARVNEGGWPLMYVSLICGAIICVGILAYSGRTRRTPPRIGVPS